MLATNMNKAIYPLIILSFIAFFTTSCSKPTESCFTCSQKTITRDSIITFDASCSGNASYFAWNFGDDTKDTTTTSLKIKHKFAKTGQFIVNLVAKRKDGVTMGKDTKASELITVY